MRSTPAVAVPRAFVRSSRSMDSSTGFLSAAARREAATTRGAEGSGAEPSTTSRMGTIVPKCADNMDSTSGRSSSQRVACGSLGSPNTATPSETSTQWPPENRARDRWGREGRSVSLQMRVRSTSAGIVPPVGAGAGAAVGAASAGLGSAVAKTENFLSNPSQTKTPP